MKEKMCVGAAIIMVMLGAMSIMPTPVKANPPECCAPSNPYHCNGSGTCKTTDTCTILSGTC